MKRIFIFSLLMIAFVMNAVAQWNEDSKIRETHWFGQYEYLDQLAYLNEKTINWSGNYIQSIEIVKTNTGQDPVQRPMTSFYSWLDHQLRFSVDDTGSWTIDGSNNSAYSAASQGQGLKNNTWQPQNFHIHNLQSGDEYTITYYENGGSQATKITESATGTATVSIPGQAVIRCVEIKLAEYVASDFKVEEVSGEYVSSLTSSHNSFLSNQGVNAQFGDIGYRYSFKGPGVLEDKRGAAPYITMKFGNDNDMTFVRALGEIQVNYGDLKQVTPKMFTKNGGETNGVASTPNEEGVYVVQSIDNPSTAWDTQFWIGTDEYPLPAGQKFKIKFDYKADADASVDTQTHGANPGSYIIWHCIGSLNFTTGWQTFEKEITIENDMAGWQSIAFNLNVSESANNYYFKNIELYIPERTETISDADLAAASIIHESNDLDPDKEHLQYRWTFKDSNFGNRFSEAEIRDRMEGKEWSTFTAKHPTSSSSGVHPDSNGEYVNGVNYIYGDEFSTIWPLCGNFFYFFPEVDGLLEIDYYCEGSNETNAFWYKQDAAGNLLTVDDQPKVQFINANGQNIGNRTDGTNNYKMMVNVEKGGIYYLCSLPTNISHERPIFRLKSYIFIPRFRVAPLYKVVHNTEVNTTATQKVAEIVGGPYTDLNGGQPGGYGNNSYELTGNFTRNAEPEARVKCLGNVASAKAYVEWDGSKQWLSFSDIKFKEGANVNHGGAIVAHVNNDMGQASFVLTIAYDAADAKWNDAKDTRVAATTGGKEVKHWDFYSGNGDGIDGGWDLGKYVKDDDTRYDPDGGDDQDWFGKSRLFKEVHKADGFTTDWEYDYVDVPNKKEPIFKSIYDMEGDNADMIHETAGLVFLTEPNELGIWNENEDPESKFQDRFIGLMGGGKLIIPRLKKDDRVVIKMGCFGNCPSETTSGEGSTTTGEESTSDFEQKAVLTLTNAKDAKGTPITGDYVIGGSTPFADETSPANTQPHGEYHFIVAEGSESDDTDFAIEVKEAGLLKIYSIAIYRNAANSNKDILTENSVTTADGPELLFTDEDAENSTKDMEFYLRYNGFEEPKAFGEFDNNYTRGNLNLTSNSFSEGSKENSLKATFTKGDFGSFRADATVKTKDTGNTYVTDYAPGSLAVDYLEKVDDGYPYTWDFTDLLYIVQTSSTYISNAINTERTGDLVTDYKGWADNAGTLSLRNAPEQEPGILFASGGQIYGANVMFAEMAGIGFKRSTESPEDAKLLNKAMGVKSGALELNSDKKDVFYKLVIPKVDADAAIYVRATPVRSDDKFVAQYKTDGESASNLKILDVTTPNDVAPDDKIYVMKNDGDEQDIELWLNGMAIKKIAVATDEKKVNEEGWNTESRDHAIDPSLLPYMTGLDFRTYIVAANGVDADNKTVTLQRVDGGKGPESDGSEDKDDKNTRIVPAATDDSPNACIIRYVGTKDGENIFEDGNGFHLFAPDMHDKPTANAKIPGNLLKAQLSATSNTGVVPRTETIEGTTYYNYAFTNKWKYVDEDGDELEGRGGQHTGKQAFYLIMNGGAQSPGNQAYLSLSSKVPAARLLLYIEGEEDDSEVTGIATLENVVDDENVRFYNLNGQQLSGKPNRSGLYIVNGKKVSIKNK